MCKDTVSDVFGGKHGVYISGFSICARTLSQEGIKFIRMISKQSSRILKICFKYNPPIFILVGDPHGH